MNKCTACADDFEWNDYVVIVDDKLYHKDCLELNPTGYFAMLGGEPLGETENEDGQMAFEIIDGLLTEDEDDVKECAFCHRDVDVSKKENFEYLDDEKICCSPCHATESDTGE